MLDVSLIRETRFIINSKQYLFSVMPKVDLQNFSLESPKKYVMCAFNVHNPTEYSKMHLVATKKLLKLKEENKLDSFIEKIRTEIVEELVKKNA